MPARYSYELRTTVTQMLRKNPDERPSAEALLRKRFFTSPANHLPLSRRISSAPPAVKLNRKALGSLAVYASPLLPRRASSALAGSTTNLKRNKKKSSPRRRWNLPTETLISALSSLGLSDEDNDTLKNENEEDEDVTHSSSTDESNSSSCSILVQTYVLNMTDSATHKLERWMVKLEEIHGVHQLKQGSINKKNRKKVTQFN